MTRDLLRAAATLLVAALVGGPALAEDAVAETTDAKAPPPPPTVVPTFVDEVERGVRLRLDLGGRYMRVSSPSQPVRLEVEQPHETPDDVDVDGLVLFAWDRPFGMPIKGDLFGEGRLDADPEPLRSPFHDDQSAAPRARLYSAFVGLSPAPRGPLAPFRLNVGRQTELVESPITYDGASAGARFHVGSFRLGAHLWGGLDAPQRMADDPFTRRDGAAYTEVYERSKVGAVHVQRTFEEAPRLNVVGGARLDAELFGVGLEVDHAVLAAQRSRLQLSYLLDTELGMAFMAMDVRATELLPRSARVVADALTADGSTRVGGQVKVQFLEDLVAFDSTFLAFNPRATFDPVLAADVERARRSDQIRHLNIPPPLPHVLALVDAERTLLGPFSVTGRARVRKHFSEEHLDYFRSDLYEAAAGARYQPSMGLALGGELVGGVLDTGKPDAFAFDLEGEGLASYAELRMFTRFALLAGQLSMQNEVFVRRQDLVTRAFAAAGQWSGAFATSLRYDLLRWWSVGARVDADVLAPFEAVNATSYVAAHAATTLTF